jgi:hypothetical protein
MVLYAASNVMAVTVPAEAGGCVPTTTHRRPVLNGVPVHPWGLECPPCEDFLRLHQPDQWSATLSELPETYDETKAREDFEKRGARDKDALMTLIMAKSVGIDPSQLPESLTRMVTGMPLHIPGLLECPNGHASPAGQRFCGECGAPMSAGVAKAALEAPGRPPAPPAGEGAAGAGEKKRRISDLRLDELQAVARSRGVPTGGTRRDLIVRLKASGMRDRDLAAAA